MNRISTKMQFFSSFFDKLSVGNKLATGFGAVLLILVALVAFIEYELVGQDELQSRMVELRVPTNLAGHDLVSGINYSLAALRGYMILGEDAFKQQRVEAWQQIDEHLGLMEKMSENWTVQKNIDQLADLKNILARFKLAQQRVEDVSHSADEQPAIKILLTQAAPKAKLVVEAITGMINEEKKQAATAERKALLATFADSRGSFAMGLASIRAYLISGEQKWADDFNNRWAVNTARLSSIQKNRRLLSQKQLTHFESYVTNREQFEPYPAQMFEIRGSKKWNVANYILGTEAAPEAGKALAILKDMVESQSQLVAADVESIKRESSLIKLVSVIAALIALVVGGFIAWFISRAITAPLGQAISAANHIASGDLSVTIDVTSQDETGQLLQTMKDMQKKLSGVIEKDVQSIVDAAKEGDLSERIKLAGKDGFYKKLSNSINELVEVNEQVVNDTVRIFSAMAEGDLSQRINADYKGAFNSLKQDANRTVDKITNVIEGDIQGLIDSTGIGDLSQRIDLNDKEGFYKSLSGGINKLVDISEKVLNDSTRVMAAMAKGDLTETINDDYQGIFGQLKNDTNNTIVKLKDVISEIRDASNQVATGAVEIADGNTDLSQRTEEQAASLEETASSMEEITSAVQQSEENARNSASLAVEAKEIAEGGGNIVSQAVEAMEMINRSSKEIADIIGVIDEIAFQTNLLALNAAVEAARAGEQGRGFAVVASEVRNLAQRSADAAKEIKGLISDSEGKVSEGTILVNKAGETLVSIVQAVDDVSQSVADISRAASEQNIGIQLVNNAVSQMDEVTQQNAALVEEATAASVSMREQANNTLSLVNFFKMENTQSDQQ